ncbi:MAG: PLP-dependent transferase, partial [Actinomycetota bacterium]
HKAALFEVLRASISLVANLATAGDWQSPSFEHSVHSMAGRYTGRITEHHDDYKRDRHADAEAFERAYLREYARPPAAVRARALMTTCGMAAFTTILAMIERDLPGQGPVLVGASTYHECKDLILTGALGARVLLVDEGDTSGLLAAVGHHRPPAIFLDSLCNAKGILVPDIHALVHHLRAQGPNTLLVIDNTGLSAAFRPLSLQRADDDPIRIVAHESLTKYPQWGLDKVTGGMILAPVREGAALADLREHLGTNVCDASVRVVPLPHRRLFERRLLRLSRNARLLAGHVQISAGEMGGGVVTGAVHPGLPGHPSSAVAGRRPFTGGFLAIEFAAGFDTIETHRSFLHSLFERARHLHVPLTAGASFGLNTTRAYLTAVTSDHGAPFVRVSPGTEHRLGIEDLKRVLSCALTETARRSERAGS